jgi:peptidoglycan/LPS O-acetylase OafA/YrhL
MTSLLARPVEFATKEGYRPLASVLNGSQKHVPALDGIRGLAVLLVLVFHIFQVEPVPQQPLLRLGYSATHFGHTGVDLFFVLSGLLITGILLDTRNSPRFFVNFYGRRTLRIFPLYYGVLLVFLLVLPRLLGGPLTRMPDVYLWTFSTNFALAAGADGGLLSHFWTLAIEEHFYLVWPMLVFTLSRPALMRVCLVGLAAAAALRIGFESQGIPSFQLTFCRIDGLLLGAMIALAARSPVGQKDWSRPALLVAVIAGLVTLPLCLFLRGSGSVWMAAVKYPVVALFYGAFLVVGITAGPRSWIGSILSSSPLRGLGKYSYGIYVYHPALISTIGYLFARAGIDPAAGGGAAGGLVLTLKIGMILAASFLTAWLSWHLYEKRFLALKRFLEYQRVPRQALAPTSRLIARKTCTEA